MLHIDAVPPPARGRSTSTSSNYVDHHYRAPCLVHRVKTRANRKCSGGTDRQLASFPRRIREKIVRLTHVARRRHAKNAAGRTRAMGAPLDVLIAEGMPIYLQQ